MTLDPDKVKLALPGYRRNRERVPFERAADRDVEQEQLEDELLAEAELPTGTPDLRPPSQDVG